MRPELEQKVEKSIKILQKVAEVKEDIELAYSGGKDSDVILELAKMAQIPFTPIYKNTTIDPPGTLAHCRRNKVQIVDPKHTFFELIEKKGFPTRRCRFCCSELKEYKIKDTVILGIRREESTARAKRYKEPTLCRIYNKSEEVEQILPILDWNLNDVSDFLKERRVMLAVNYFDTELQGYDLTRRLGCVGCPLAADNGVKDFRMYPKMLAKWIEHGKIWWESHPNTKSHIKFRDIYALMAHNLFFKSYSQFEVVEHNLFGSPNWKAYLEEYFKINL